MGRRRREEEGRAGWGWGVGAFRALSRVSVLLVQFSSVQFSSRWCLCARTRVYLPVGYDLCEAQIRLSSRPLPRLKLQTHFFSEFTGADETPYIKMAALMLPLYVSWCGLAVRR